MVGSAGFQERLLKMKRSDETAIINGLHELYIKLEIAKVVNR